MIASSLDRHSLCGVWEWADSEHGASLERVMMGDRGGVGRVQSMKSVETVKEAEIRSAVRGNRKI